MAAEAQPVPPTDDVVVVVDGAAAESAVGATTGDRLRSAARRARSIWCGILSGLG